MLTLRASFLLAMFTLFIGCADDKSDVGGPNANAAVATVEFAPTNVISGGQEGAEGSGALTLDSNNLLSGDVLFDTNFIPTNITLNAGFAGEQSTFITNLQKLDDQHWKILDNVFLSATERDLMVNGGLHLLSASASFPDGATRGQLLTGGVEVFPFDLLDTQIIPPVQSAGTAKGFFTFNNQSTTANVHINVSNTSIFSATINNGVAGVNGTESFILLQDNQNPNHWSLQNQSLSTDEVDFLKIARLYAQLNSNAFPNGELRGQIVPSGIVVDFILLTGTEAVDNGAMGVDTAATGIAATTLDVASKALTAHLNTSTLPTATAASLNLAVAGFNGAIAVMLEQDMNNISHWFIDDSTLSNNSFASVTAQATYFSVETPLFPDGEIRGQWLFVAPEDGVAAAPENPAATLSAIQQAIFTPNCATGGCHSGIAPAAGLNLSAGETFDNVVEVSSSEVPSLLRVNPGNPHISYLLQKVEGAAGIVGGRMPLGGAPLSAEDILSIREWVDNGAKNN